MFYSRASQTGFPPASGFWNPPMWVPERMLFAKAILLTAMNSVSLSKNKTGQSYDYFTSAI